MEITACDIAERFLGLAEIPGPKHNPIIAAMVSNSAPWTEPTDEIAWCGVFVDTVACILDLDRPPGGLALRARRWLTVGDPIPQDLAQKGPDIVILKRGSGPQPGPEVLDAPGHVGFFVGWIGDQVEVLGGNQGNKVSVARFPSKDILGVVRLHSTNAAKLKLIAARYNYTARPTTEGLYQLAMAASRYVDETV